MQPELTHLGYFSLTIGPNGDILTRTNGGTDIGFHKLQSDQVTSLIATVKKNHGKFEVVFTQMNNDDITHFFLSPAAHQKFLTSLDSVLTMYPVDGINIDVEYAGIVTSELRAGFSSFLVELHTTLQSKNKNIALSTDIYPTGANDTQIWDIPKVSGLVDHIIVMAYDFHRKSSPLAGPVAPLFGGHTEWDGDITLYLKKLLETVPPSKVLLGIPFYGYEWQTTVDEPQAHTYSDTGSTATIEYVQHLLSQKDILHVQQHWNEAGLSPYISYVKNSNTYTVYYENARSLSYKMELVNQLDLGGIAIWALGYENNSREVWDVIKQKL